MDKLHGLAPGRDAIKPAPRSDVVVTHPKYATGERIRAAKVVQQPSVNLEPSQRFLDGFDV
jgi:hypothetical protein